jgi:hypothetical protein
VSTNLRWTQNRKNERERRKDGSRLLKLRMKMLLPLIREEGEFQVLMRLSQLKWGRKLSISSLPAGNQLLLLAKKEKLA